MVRCHCGNDKFVVAHGTIGCALCGYIAPYGFTYDQLVEPNDYIVEKKALDFMLLDKLDFKKKKSWSLLDEKEVSHE